jgi:hypothetical protein
VPSPTPKRVTVEAVGFGLRPWTRRHRRISRPFTAEGPLTKPISWVALLIWADSPVVVIAMRSRSDWRRCRCSRLSRCAGGEFGQPVTGQHPKCCLGAPCQQYGYADGPMEIRPDPAQAMSVVVGGSPLSRLLAQKGHPVDQTRVPQDAAATVGIDRSTPTGTAMS